MTPTPASAASADLLVSLPSPKVVQFGDSPIGRRGFVNPQEASFQGRCLPGQSQDLRARDYGSKSSDTMAGSASNGMVTELHQKRKREDDPSLCSQEHRKEPINDLKLHETSIAGTWNTSTSYHNLIPSTKGFCDKRPKLDESYPENWTRENKTSNAITLPAELWQYIFSFVPPISLGRLLCVNRTFHAYLDEANNGEAVPAVPNSIAQLMKAKNIWFASRKRFCPGLPRSLGDLSELAIWKLLRGSNCELCGKPSATSTPTSAGSPWENGPGATGVRIIWPFGVRTCASCLKDVTKTELELLLSSDCPSILLHGLPFAFISDEKHFIAHTTMRNSTALPTTLTLTKHYYKPHIETIKSEFKDARELSGASAEEWIKGLAQQGQQRIASTIPWEQYEAKGGLKKVNAPPQPKRSTPSAAIAEGKAPTPAIKTEPQLERANSHTLGHQASFGANQRIPIPPKPLESAFISPNAMRPQQPTWNAFNPFPVQAPFGQPVPNHQLHQPKPERNLREVNEAKAARRADIERRCTSLDPPIPPNLLNQMESFQAALQISQPMTDPAWQVLKPRLLAQLPYAERREKERAHEASLKDEESKQRRQQEALLKESKDGLEREWETFQGPIRNRIGALADEIIDTRWSKGRSITKETAPKFAADVLVQVRKRFYVDKASDEEAILSFGGIVKADPPNGSPVPTLTLENMKWVFDNKIKPLTDHYQRELFLCSECGGNLKFYGFEGVIQHFAAKHTTEFSLGNVVVHWRAEWPELSPFHPNPSPSMTAFYKIPTPNATSGPNTSSVDSAGTTGNGGYLSGIDSGLPISTTPGLAIPTVSQQIPATPMTFLAQPYPSTTVGPREQENTFQRGMHGVHTSIHESAAHSATATQPWQAPQVHGSSYPGSYPYSSGAPPSYAPATQGFPHSPFGTSVSQAPASYQIPYSSGSLVTSPGLTMPAQQSDLYYQQMEEMARHAKEIFFGLGGVKDVPGSVRVFATIQHTVLRFKMAFATEPTLQMFMDGLDHNATMRPVRSVNGIACKTCVISGTATGVDSQNHGKIVGDRRLYTLPHLVNHFKSAHVDSCQTSGAQQSRSTTSHDWKKDMIELPDASLISGLATAPGMTDSKLALISAVLPEAFAYRHASLNIVTDTKSYSSNPINGFDSFTSLPQVSPDETPGDDEYDPLRPAILHMSTRIDPNIDVPPAHAKPVIPQHGQQTFVQGRDEEYRPTAPSSLHNESFVGNNNSRDILSNGHYTSHENVEPLGGAVSPPGSRYGSKKYEPPRNIEQPRQKMLNDMKHLSEPLTTSAYVMDHTGDGRGSQSAKHGRPANGATEGDDAADRFLSSLGSSTHQTPLETLRILDHERLEPPPQYFDDAGTRGDRWAKTDQRRNSVEVPDTQIPPRSAMPMEENSPHAQPGSLSRPLREDESRIFSHMQTPFKTASLFEDCEPIMLTRAPRNELQSYHVSKVPQYRGRSRSPLREVPESTLYRTRSPVEEDRGESVYHVPDAPLRRSQGADRIVSYKYPLHDRYEYINERTMEPWYQARVECLPSRIEEPLSRGLPRERTRYVIAQSEEHVAQPEYFHYEPMDDTEQFYEIDGRLVPASEVQYVEGPSRAMAPYSREYRY